MKPVFSTDRTQGRKNSVYNAEKFSTATISDATADKLWEAEEKKIDIKYDDQKIPRKNKLINDIALVAIFVMLGIMTLIGSTKGEDLLFKLSPIFIVGLVFGYGVMIWNKKYIRNLKPEENKSDKELEAERSYDSMVRLALDEFLFPYDAKSIDVIYFCYKKEEQIYDLSKLSCFTEPLKVFKKGSTLYMTDLDRKYEISISKEAYLERVNGKVKLFGRYSDINFKEPKYNIDGVTIVDDTDIKCDSYGIYRFTYEGEEYGIYIANYDIPTFEEILNS